jgi:hypothetical protein
MKGLCKLALVALVVAACGGEVGITEPVAPTAPPMSGGILALGVDSITGASIETNKDDYSPGEVVHLVGRGWAAGETVNLHMTEAPNTHADVDTNVVADASGGFDIHFYDVQPHDFGVTFTLTATGQTSGSRAVATFTDGRSVNAVTLNPVSPVPASTSIDAAVRVLINSGTGAQVWKATKWEVVNTSSVVISSSACIDTDDHALNDSDEFDGNKHEESVSFTSPPTSGAYNLRISLYSADNCGANANDPTTGSFAFSVSSSNTAPTLSGVPTTTQNIPELSAFTFDANASDGDLPAQTLTFSIVGSIPSGASFNTGTGEFSWTPTEAQGASGPHTFTVRLSDGTANTDQVVTINVTEVNAAPTLGGVPTTEQFIPEQALYTFTATKSDTDVPAQTLTFSIEGSLPSGATFNPATGIFEWTPTDAQGPSGPHTFTVRVTDGVANTDQLVTLNVTEVNAAPVLTDVPTTKQSIPEMVSYTFDADASDSDVPAQTLTFSIVGTVPVGATFNTATGEFAWTPTEAQGPSGPHTFTVRVSDGVTNTDQLVTIDVEEVNVAPVLTGVPITSQSIPEMVSYTFDANASDSDIPVQPLTFSIVNGSIPSGASFNTATGEFEWTPSESQGPSGPHTFTVRVSDGVVYTDQSVTINVFEVNRAPALTVPSNFSTQWGVALADLLATATDPDLPANGLAFSLVSGPSWVTVDADGTINFGSIASSAVGPQTVTIKVDDDGSPGMSDTKSFTITVVNRPTALEYTGKNAGQYSDESTLSAKLTDNGAGAKNGDVLVGQKVDLWFNGSVACNDVTTDSNGVASCDHAVSVEAQTVTVDATFDAANGYAASNAADENFVVSEEHAEFVSVSINGGNGSIPVSQTSFHVTLGTREKRDGSNNEPNQNDGQLPGNINLATVSAKIVGLALNTTYNGVCTAGAAVATDQYVTRNWSCLFSGGPFDVDAYTLVVDIPLANTYWVATTYEEGMAIWDPAAGFATGGGTFLLDGDRVSFGFSYTLTKGKSTPRSGFVVIRHMAAGGVCRIKSNNQLNAPAVNGNTVTLSGKGNYSCVDANGLVIVGQSQGNVTIGAYAEDNATSGADADKFWVTNSASVTPNYLKMDGSGGAAANAIKLRGGNVQVPQPENR